VPSFKIKTAKGLTCTNVFVGAMHVGNVFKYKGNYFAKPNDPRIGMWFHSRMKAGGNNQGFRKEQEAVDDCANDYIRTITPDPPRTTVRRMSVDKDAGAAPVDELPRLDGRSD